MVRSIRGYYSCRYSSVLRSGSGLDGPIDADSNRTIQVVFWIGLLAPFYMRFASLLVRVSDVRYELGVEPISRYDGDEYEPHDHTAIGLAGGNPASSLILAMLKPVSS